MAIDANQGTDWNSFIQDGILGVRRTSKRSVVLASHVVGSHLISHHLASRAIDQICSAVWRRRPSFVVDDQTGDKANLEPGGETLKPFENGSVEICRSFRPICPSNVERLWKHD